MQTGSSGTLIGWKSGQTTFVPPWDWMEGAWLRTLVSILISSLANGILHQLALGDVLRPSRRGPGIFCSRRNWDKGEHFSGTELHTPLPISEYILTSLTQFCFPFCRGEEGGGPLQYVDSQSWDILYIILFSVGKEWRWESVPFTVKILYMQNEV